MAETLLFITGVLTGIIVGFLFARRTRGSAAPNGSSERFLEDRLSKVDRGAVLIKSAKQPKIY